MNGRREETQGKGGNWVSYKDGRTVARSQAVTSTVHGTQKRHKPTDRLKSWNLDVCMQVVRGRTAVLRDHEVTSLRGRRGMALQ